MGPNPMMGLLMRNGKYGYRHTGKTKCDHGGINGMTGLKAKDCLNNPITMIWC